MLIQESDSVTEDPATFTVPTLRQPTPEELTQLLFAWKVAKTVKSQRDSCSPRTSRAWAWVLGR